MEAEGSTARRSRTSLIKTCFNLINALSGVGILSLPHAVASGGWGSMVFFVTIAVTSYYTALLLQRCVEADESIATYPQIGEKAFGKTGKLAISVVMNVMLYLVATGLLIIEGDHLHKLFPGARVRLAARLTLEGKQLFIVAVALAVLPSVWLANMNFLAYISAGSVLASLLLVGSVLWIGAFEGVGFGNGGVAVNWKGMPRAISLYAFCYSAHPIFPTIYNSMARKEHFSKAMMGCFVFSTSIYALMAVAGYLMFGEQVQSEVTLNLPDKKLSGMIAIYTTLVYPIFKYALELSPIIEDLEVRFPTYFGRRSYKMMLGAALVFSTAAVALAVPLYGDLMSLVGAFLDSIGSIIFPCLCYLKITGIYRSHRTKAAGLVAIVVMGVTLMVTGTYTSIRDIVLHLGKV